MITIPSLLTTPEERAKYLVEHYWDNFDYSDISFISHPEIMEQALADYLDVLPYVSVETANASLVNTMNKAAVDISMYKHFLELYEKYLYEPNSPLMNEEFLIPVLESVVNASVLNEADKIRPESLLQLILKNRVGAQAADFSFVLENGQTQTLYRQNAEFVLLMFYNPGCHSCNEVLEHMRTSLGIQTFLANKKLKIVAVYPDEDLTEWKSYLSRIPAEWINGYNKNATLKNEEVYDLKAIPSLYLLGKDKTVLLKDVTMQVIESYLGML